MLLRSYKSTYGKAIYAGYLVRYVADTNIVLPEFVFSLTQTDYYKEFVVTTQHAMAQPNINAREYGNFVIFVPPIDLQNQFAVFVKQCDKTKADAQKRKEALHTQREQTIEKYFR